MEIEVFYDQFAHQEWSRLEKCRTEFAVTAKALKEFLPASPGSALDIGGGPGRYSIELARWGYAVTLVEISGESLKLAQEKAREAQVRLAGFIHASALDLDELDSASFDAVLLLGPLYHLLSHAERVRAIQEAMRVLQPHGRLFAAFITRFAPFRYMANGEPDGSSTVNRGHVHHRSTRAFVALEGRPRRFGGGQRGNGTRNESSSSTVQR